MSASKKKLERRQAALNDTTFSKKQEKNQKGTVKGLYTLIGVVVATLLAALLIWRSGIIPRHTTALVVKDHKYSVVDMDYFYYQALNQAYAQDQQMASFYAQLGLGEYTPSFDPFSDLKTQYVDEEQTQSYHDKFKEDAKAMVVEYTALYDAAKAENYTLSEDGQASLDQVLADLDESVSNGGFPSRDAYLKRVYGHNMTERVYLRNLKMCILASDYSSHKLDSMGDYSDEDIMNYYEENPGPLDSYTYNYVYFDGSAPSTTDSEGNTVPATDEEVAVTMAAAKQKAEGLMSAVRAAETSPADETVGKLTGSERFAYVAMGFTSDNTVRTDVLGKNFSSTPYGEWLMDRARTDGDMEMFEVEKGGYYVIQYHSHRRNDDPTVDVRHILLSTSMEDDPETEDVDESQNPTDAHIAEVRTQAQGILDEYNQGEKTPEAFGELAEEHSADGRDSEGNLNASGGLYTGVKPGDMVKEFDEWIFDPSRQPGDTGLVKTQFGWHVMYFQGSNEPVWKGEARTDKLAADQEAWNKEVREGYEAEETSAFAKVGVNNSR